MDLVVFKVKKPNRNYEFIEVKGKGHPDVLADELAEELSRNYSNYTKERFGAALHHNFDKLSLLGGSSFVKFGEGYLTSPIRVILNGRASNKFGSEEINIKEILYETIYNYFSKKFNKIVPTKNVKIYDFISNQSSPGKTYEKVSERGTRRYWFQPRNLNDLLELSHLGANDTTLGCGFAPLSKTEITLRKLEYKINSDDYKKDKKWLGSDIKIMGVRIKKKLDVTMCIPQIANYVQNLEEYKKNLDYIRKDIIDYISNEMNYHHIKLNINTRDNYDSCELYLTAIGSSIESGDEGVVGRGNMLCGFISSLRPFSHEGICGKNPVYHSGKLYNLLAQRLANKIYKETNKYNEVFIISQSGRLLVDPWKIIVGIDTKKNLQTIIEEEIADINKITESLLKGKTLWDVTEP